MAPDGPGRVKKGEIKWSIMKKVKRTSLPVNDGNRPENSIKAGELDSFVAPGWKMGDRTEL